MIFYGNIMNIFIKIYSLNKSIIPGALFMLGTLFKCMEIDPVV